MLLNTVRSQAIHAIGYDRDQMVLEVVFSSGGIYRYVHVPPQVYWQFINSPSKGQYFQRHIKGSYASQRLSRRKAGRISPKLLAKQKAQAEIAFTR